MQKVLYNARHDTTIAITLVKFEASLKIYMKAAIYLLQTYISQRSRNCLNSELSILPIGIMVSLLTLIMFAINILYVIFSFMYIFELFSKLAIIIMISSRFTKM